MDINEFKIKLVFSIEEMNMVFRFLETLPYGEVAGLMDNVKKQVDEQLIPVESFDNAPEEESTTNTDYPI
jgi:hypothetical protein